MSVQEVKGTLAKLLATEDLIIEHRQVSTASFDVHRRLLTLPVWNRASETVYDLLVSHEVGHALFTPDEDVEGVPMGFVNITEDARIEKLMKRKYPGLPKTFYRGYSELSDQDFFNVADEDIDSMNLADRVNLYFKIGSFLKVSFTPEEQVLVDQTAAAETFEEAIEAAKAIFLFMKSPETQQEKVANSSSGEDTQDTDVGDGEESEEGELREDADLNTPSYQKDSDDMSGDFDQPDAKSGFEDQIEEELKTQNSFDENISDLSSPHAQQNNYVSRPKLNLHRIITSNKHIHDRIGEWWEQIGTDTCFDHIDSHYNSFKKSAQKEVNYLVKEFEMKKSANQYSRSSIARTGVLDCTKLHTYKYNDDLFKKVTVVPEGKNHGLLFILDWSGSMSDCLVDTIKQLYNLIWFCRKVNIPYDVYAFTLDNPTQFVGDEPLFVREEGVFALPERFGMMNLLSSKMSNKESEKQLLNIWRNVCSICAGRFKMDGQYVYTSYPQAPFLGLSGTPLNESILCLYEIIPNFIKQHGLQNVNCVILTDGEAQPLHRTFWWKYPTQLGDGDDGRWGVRTCDDGRTVFRDRKTGTMTLFPYEYWKFTQSMLENLKLNFPNVNFIGIRIAGSGDAKRMVRMHCNHDFKKIDPICTKLTKEKTATLFDTGYDAFFLMVSTALSNSTEFEVEEGAKKSTIRSAFKKSLASKKMNKKVLNEFIAMVA